MTTLAKTKAALDLLEREWKVVDHLVEARVLVADARKELAALSPPTPEDVARAFQIASQGSGIEGPKPRAIEFLRDWAARVPGLESDNAALKEGIQTLRDTRRTLSDELSRAESERDAARQEVETLRFSVDGNGWCADVLLKERDALTARVAELEREKEERKKGLQTMQTIVNGAVHRAEEAEARATAAEVDRRTMTGLRDNAAGIANSASMELGGAKALLWEACNVMGEIERKAAPGSIIGVTPQDWQRLKKAFGGTPSITPHHPAPAGLREALERLNAAMLALHDWDAQGHKDAGFQGEGVEAFAQLRAALGDAFTALRDVESVTVPAAAPEKHGRSSSESTGSGESAPVRPAPGLREAVGMAIQSMHSNLDVLSDWSVEQGPSGGFHADVAVAFARVQDALADLRAAYDGTAPEPKGNTCVRCHEPITWNPTGGEDGHGAWEHDGNTSPGCRAEPRLMLASTPEPTVTHAQLAAVVEAYAQECEDHADKGPHFDEWKGAAAGAREVLRRVTGWQVPETLPTAPGGGAPVSRFSKVDPGEDTANGKTTGFDDRGSESAAPEVVWEAPGSMRVVGPVGDERAEVKGKDGEWYECNVGDWPYILARALAEAKRETTTLRREMDVPPGFRLWDGSNDTLQREKRKAAEDMRERIALGMETMAMRAGGDFAQVLEGLAKVVRDTTVD
jgi:hypothetical protein